MSIRVPSQCILVEGDCGDITADVEIEAGHPDEGKTILEFGLISADACNILECGSDGRLLVRGIPASAFGPSTASWPGGGLPGAPTPIPPFTLALASISFAQPCPDVGAIGSVTVPGVTVAGTYINGGGSISFALAVNAVIDGTPFSLTTTATILGSGPFSVTLPGQTFTAPIIGGGSVTASANLTASGFQGGLLVNPVTVSISGWVV